MCEKRGKSSKGERPSGGGFNYYFEPSRGERYLKGSPFSKVTMDLSKRKKKKRGCFLGLREMGGGIGGTMGNPSDHLGSEEMDLGWKNQRLENFIKAKH